MSYEVVAAGETFRVGTFRQMRGLARSMERHGIAARCQMRNGATLLCFQREAWA